MCVICIDWEKGKMTSKEAMDAIREVIDTTDLERTGHLVKLAERIVNKEFPEPAAQDVELDAEWERKNRGSN